MGVFLNMFIKEAAVEESVLKLARQVADDQRVEVIGVRLLGNGRKKLLRVTIDKEEGVTLDDCERFSRNLDLLLETTDIIRDSYTLEVSSPGLDRPLTILKDFEKNMGKLVRVITKEKVDNQNFFLGRIVSISGDRIGLNVGGRTVEIVFDNISKAKLEIEIK
jgi:ribosome maturation factor RimP